MAIASSTPGPASASSAPTGDDLVRRRLGVQPHPVLLEVHRPPAAGRAPASSTTTWVSTRSSLIGSSRTPRSASPQRAHSAAVTVAERVAGAEHLGADDVGREVAVAEPEPGRPARRSAASSSLTAKVSSAPAPALLLVDAAAEGVHHGVQVGADPQPEQRDVVAGVADHGDLGPAPARGAWAAREQAAQEPGGADAAGRDDDVHAGVSLAGRRATRRKQVGPFG